MKINSKSIRVLLVLSLGLITQGFCFQSFAEEPFLGEIHLMAFDYAPRHWLRCEGQILPINQNQALFSLLGTQFGGNGVNTFALPDLRMAEPQPEQPGYGMRYCISIQGIFPSRN